MTGAIALILAGGRGSRMNTLCHDRPKPALPFGGRFRVIDFTLSNCFHSQIGNISVIADYQRAIMAAYLRRWQVTNDRYDGLHVLEPPGSSYAGTADAVYRNLDRLQRHHANRVLVLAGDHIYKMDYRRMLAFHEQAGADVTVGAVAVPIEEVQRFGIITADGSGRITNFTEKPDVPRSNLVSMGIYIFNWPVLAQRLAEDAAEPFSPHDFGHAVIPAMVRRDRVFAYRFNDYWQDIGTTAAYYQANIGLASRHPPLSLDGGWPVLTAEDFLPPAKRHHHGNIKNSIVSPGCVIRGQVENSVLSPGVWVNEQAVVRNSVLMSNAFVGYHSVVDSAILDGGVNVGKFCYIGYGAGAAAGEDITVLGRGTIVPPHTAIGRGRVLPQPAGYAGNTLPGYLQTPVSIFPGAS